VTSAPRLPIRMPAPLRRRPSEPTGNRRLHRWRRRRGAGSPGAPDSWVWEGRCSVHAPVAPRRGYATWAPHASSAPPLPHVQHHGPLEVPLQAMLQRVKHTGGHLWATCMRHRQLRVRSRWPARSAALQLHHGDPPQPQGISPCSSLCRPTCQSFCQGPMSLQMQCLTSLDGCGLCGKQLPRSCFSESRALAMRHLLTRQGRP